MANRCVASKRLNSGSASVMPGVQDRRDFKVLPNPNLAKDGGGLDKTLLAQSIRHVVNAKLGAIYELTGRAKEMKSLADMAERLGDETTSEAARVALQGLVAAAKT